jgi:outer membrane protein TolC
VRNLTQAALAQFLATEEARKTAQISLIAQVANDLPDLLADEELLAVTQQTLKTRDESLRLTQLRFDNGVVVQARPAAGAYRWSNRPASRWPSRPSASAPRT